MKKCEIYASAQLFGFGPTALLLATLDAYEKDFTQSSQITLLGSKNLSILLNGRLNGFQIIKPKGVSNELEFLFKSQAYNKFDLFVSFFNPAPVLYSWFYNKKSVFHDGLFDFWDIPSFEARLEKDLEYVRNCKKEGNVKRLLRWYNVTFKSNPHQVIFMTHYFASRNYIRNNTVVDSVLNRFQELKNKAMFKVGCIIDPQLDKTSPDSEEHFLVSLGGSIAPVISLKQNIYYAKQIIHLVNLMAQKEYLNKYPWYVFCHPRIHRALNTEKLNLLPNVKIVSSIGMLSFMKMIRTSKAVLVPPGYGTVQEACYSNKPIFFIPEQNAGQPLYFKTLQDNKFPYQNSLTLTGDLNNGDLIYKEFDIDRMYGDIDTLIHSGEYQKLRKKKIEQFSFLLQNKSLLKKHVERQHESLQHVPGGFDGAQTIAKGIQDEVLQYIKKS